MKNLLKVIFLVQLFIVCVVTFGLLAKSTEAQSPPKENIRVQLEGKSPVAAPPTGEGGRLIKGVTPPQGPLASLSSAKLIYVRSSSLLVGKSVVEEKLTKRPEFQRLGLMITRDINEADLVLELRHDLFTMYVYTAVDQKTSVVVAGGKLSSLGGTVAGKVAKRFLKQMVKARAGLSP
jgi:hypothetical protein